MNTKEENNIIKDERIEELINDYVYITIENFCELKGISVRTFYRIKNLEIKNIKKINTRKRKYIKVAIKEMNNKNIFIDENNQINIIN